MFLPFQTLTKLLYWKYSVSSTLDNILLMLFYLYSYFIYFFLHVIHDHVQNSSDVVIYKIPAVLDLISMGLQVDSY